MILKKTTVAFFCDFPKQFDSSNSQGRLLLIFGNNKQFIEILSFIENTIWILYKILSNVTSWRSAMILKKTSINGIFLRFS